MSKKAKHRTATQYESCIVKISANFPCTGGIIAPPKIIIIKNDEPCEVYFPIPLILNEKIQGHIIEQNKPPVKNANNAILPEANTPINIAITPNRLNIFIVVIALSFAK